MKTVAVVFLSLIFPFYSISANHDSLILKQPIQFGFSLGLNQSMMFSKSALPEGDFIVNGVGFRMGLLSVIPITPKLSFSPKAELSFNKAQLVTSGGANVYEVLPATLEFLGCFTKEFKGDKVVPFIAIGSGVKLPMELDKTLKTSKKDVSIDLYFGVKNKTPYFHMLPTIRYSIGLMNVSESTLIPSLYLHNLALILSFV